MNIYELKLLIQTRSLTPFYKQEIYFDVLVSDKVPIV